MIWLPFLFFLAVPPADATPPPRSQGAILDCESHTVWQEPDRWKAVASRDEVWALASSGRALLVHTHVRTDREKKPDFTAARALGARLAGVEPTWGKPDTVKKDKYDHVTVIEGHAGDIAVRIAQHDRGFGKDTVWIEVAQGDDRVEALATMEAARTSEKMLVDHACVCGHDCDARPH